jgi:hypothetical protein
MSELLDRAGRRRSPATMPGFHAGRPPRNKGLRYPADPPTVEEIIAVMRAAGDDAYGRRPRGLIVILWRAGLRIQEALLLAKADLDHQRGALLARRGKGGWRREVGMDAWGRGGAAALARAPRRAARGFRCCASSTAQRAASHGQAPPPEQGCAGAPCRRASGGASPRTSSGMPMPSNSRARACR